MLNIDLELLRTFAETAGRPTFAAAAAAQRVSVSAISQKIKALEGQLGVPLYERVGRRAQLTEAGRTLFGALRAPLERIDEATAEAAERTRRIAGLVRIGGPRVFVRRALTPPLGRLLDAHPGLLLEVSFDVPSVLERQLAEGALDLAVMVRPTEHPSLVSAPIGEEVFVAVAAAGHPLAAKRRATAAELAAHGAVAFDADQAMLRPWWQASFGRRIAVPEPRCRMANVDAMLALVETGAVWAVLTTSSVEESVRAGRLVVVEPVVPRGARPPRRAAHAVSLAWRRAAAETARLRVVRDALRGKT